MGWWKVQGTEDIVGDDPFMILRDATEAIAKLYEREFGRMPSRTEWQALLQDALEPMTELRSPEQVSLFAENARPSAVEIMLEPLGN
jgi:hypothetical protein